VVVNKVKTNDQAEQDINRLDIMIGLMLKNKIEWDEINSQRGQIVQRFNSVSTTSSDPLDLKALTKSARRRLELYEGLFYILQTSPDYLARYFARVKDTAISEAEIRKLEQLVMTLFSYAQKRREEYFLLRLLARAVHEEARSLKLGTDFAKGPYVWSRVLTGYVRGTKERKFLRDIFAPVIRQMIGDRDLDLECDPAVVRAYLHRGNSSCTSAWWRNKSYDPGEDDDHSQWKSPESTRVEIRIRGTCTFTICDNCKTSRMRSCSPSNAIGVKFPSEFDTSPGKFTSVCRFR
jgi:GTPase-activator protein for Ras-like GTPase